MQRRICYCVSIIFKLDLEAGQKAGALLGPAYTFYLHIGKLVEILVELIKVKNLQVLIQVAVGRHRHQKHNCAVALS